MKYGFDSKDAEVFPPTITIDITNRCSLNCVHCPQDQLAKSDRYIPHDIPLPYIRKIADELEKHENTTVRLTGDGEPFLHPKILDIIRILKIDGNVDVLTLFTNGIDLFQNARYLRHLDIIDISIDAFTSITYQKIHNTHDWIFKKVLNGIEHFEEMDYDTKIMVSFVEQPLNTHEKDQFVEYWSDKVDKVIIRSFVNCKGLIKDIPENLPDVERYPCPQLWRRINLNMFGEYRWCVEDIFNKTSFSNLWTESIASAWKHPMLERMRELHQSGVYNEICNACNNWKMSTWNSTYEFAIKEVLE